MAEAFTKHYGKGEVETLSAGTVPASKVNPVVVQALWEKGIDISKNKPKLITTQMVQEADMVIVMGCGPSRVLPSTVT